MCHSASDGTGPLCFPQNRYKVATATTLLWMSFCTLTLGNATLLKESSSQNCQRRLGNSVASSTFIFPQTFCISSTVCSLYSHLVWHSHTTPAAITSFLYLSHKQTHTHTQSQTHWSLTGDFHEAMSEAKTTPQIASQQLQRTAFPYVCHF